MRVYYIKGPTENPSFCFAFKANVPVVKNGYIVPY